MVQIGNHPAYYLPTVVLYILPTKSQLSEHFGHMPEQCVRWSHISLFLLRRASSRPYFALTKISAGHCPSCHHDDSESEESEGCALSQPSCYNVKGSCIPVKFNSHELEVLRRWTLRQDSSKFRCICNRQLTTVSEIKHNCRETTG